MWPTIAPFKAGLSAAGHALIVNTTTYTFMHSPL
ncbi:hypothetical protein, partial [Salmonella enterica]